jgi:hypothetical protein
MTINQLNELNKKLGLLEEEYKISILNNIEDWTALEIRRLMKLSYERGLTNNSCLRICRELREMIEKDLHDEELKRVYLNKIEIYYDYFKYGIDNDY